MAKSKTWDEMTPAERRVVLAQDVIAHINAKRLLHVHDNQCYVNVSVDLTDAEKDRERRWLDALPRKETISRRIVRRLMKRCDVCARGALMLARIDRFNSMKIRDLHIGQFGVGSMEVMSGDTVKALAGAFTKSQLGLIEAAFELRSPCVIHSNFFDTWIDWVGGKNAVEFGGDHKDPTSRLIAIMQNIIDHDGEFKPEVRYEVNEVAK